MFQVAARATEKIAIVDDRGSHTYGKLLDSARRVASLLLESGDDLREQRVAMLITPGFDYVAVQWGIWLAGGIAAPLAIQHPPPEWEYVLDDADVATIVVEPRWRPRLSPLNCARSLPVLGTDQITAAEPQLQLPELDLSRRAMILYTSGSTGRPKGVVTTHNNTRTQLEVLVRAWGWQASDRILHVLPLHHVHGIINVLGCALQAGATCEFLAEFNAQQVWQRLGSGEISLFMAVPTIYAKLIEAWESATSDQQTSWSQGTRQMRLMVSGSAALPVPTLEKWEQITGHRLLERYGMTEIGMALSNPLDGERRPGFVGAPLPGVDVRRTDENGDLVEDDTPGEIEIRGPSVFREYWRRPQITRSSFRDGWFRTGDVAVVEDGAYRILGRNSVDIIKTGGYKVSALEIEELLRDHSSIRDCAVVGVADSHWGERVAVCAVCCDGATLDLTELRQWGKQRMAPYKIPTLLRVCDELPRNAMGKVQKPRVAKMFSTND